MGTIFVALVGLGIMIPSVLLIIRFMTFRTVNARFQRGGERLVLPVRVHLTGRAIYHAIYENYKAGRRQGKHVFQAWSFGLETYFMKIFKRIWQTRFSRNTVRRWQRLLS